MGRGCPPPHPLLEVGHCVVPRINAIRLRLTSPMLHFVRTHISLEDRDDVWPTNIEYGKALQGCLRLRLLARTTQLQKRKQNQNRNNNDHSDRPRSNP